MSVLNFAKGQESVTRGREFESHVVNVFKRNGFLLLKKNYWMRNFDLTIDNAVKREFDIVMFSTRDVKAYVIECKAHLDTSTFVGLEQIKEFDFKLNNYMATGASSLMVTDNDFTKPVYDYAKNARIHLLNGPGLDEFERQGTFEKKIVSSVSSKVFGSVYDAAGDLLKEYL